MSHLISFMSAFNCGWKMLNEKVPEERQFLSFIMLLLFQYLCSRTIYVLVEEAKIC